VHGPDAAAHFVVVHPDAGRYNPPVDTMSESKQRELPGAGDATDRESRTEALLVEGLDHYFQGSFDEAIHLWTRVLFIDRLRRAEEMLQAAGDLLTRGDLDQARRLLANAEQASGADEKVAELWARLERVERTRQVSSPSSPIAIVDARPVRSWRWFGRMAAQIVAAGAFALLLLSLAASPVVGDWLTGTPGSASAGVAATRPLDVLSAEDVALVRARQLYARGRLAEALMVLDGVDSANGNRDAVDRMRVEIQRWLLMPRRGGSAALVESAGGRP
jgi:tetratricopeptide (TPR) repeat protein